jgi:hypothetical protein
MVWYEGRYSVRDFVLSKKESGAWTEIRRAAMG